MAVSIKELYHDPAFYEGRTITVSGWVRNLRDAKQVGFVELNDGSSLLGLQIVLEREKLSNYPEAARQNVGAALIVTGRLDLTPGLKQPFELKAETVRIEGESAPEYPLQKKRHSMEFLRGMAHLRPRTNTFSAVFRVRSTLAFAVHQFFQERGFLYVQTPIITTSDAEGAGEMFKVTTLDLQNPPKDESGRVNFQEDFFKKPAGLTVSGQLEGESFALAFQKIYTFGPTFRAENSNTARHAAEFWMIEPEMAFADLQDDMALAQDMVKFVIGRYLEKCPQEVEFFTQFFDPGLKERLCGLISSDFGHMTYTEAIAVLEAHKEKFEYPVFWGCDLQTEHERFLTEEVMKKPLFVTDYPKEIKAFYMRQNDDDKTVAAMDLLVPGIGEIIGGSQREERAEALEKRIKELGLNANDYGWYLELRKYGGARHCGFGLGFERLIMYLTGVPNIRDVIPFPRTAGSAEF